MCRKGTLIIVHEDVFGVPIMNVMIYIYIYIYRSLWHTGVYDVL